MSDPEARAQINSLLESLKPLLGTELVEAHARIADVADFAISERQNAPFVEFVHWINRRPQFIADWRADARLETRFYSRMMSGFEGCRAAYSASVYHFGNVVEIEAAIEKILSDYNFASSIGPNAAVGLGLTRRWDYEYQAYVMAYRRSLDNLTWGLSTYFKAEQSSFRQFAKTLPKQHPTAVSHPLKAVWDRHLPNFAFVAGSERGLSVRDRIAHRESVGAGTVNITAGGHSVFGGGESLSIGQRPAAKGVLRASLQIKQDALHACLTEILLTFREAVGVHEATAVASTNKGNCGT